MDNQNQHIEDVHNDFLITINEIETQMKKYIPEQQINLIKKKPNDYINSELESIKQYATTIIEYSKIKQSYEAYLETKPLGDQTDIKKFINLKFDILDTKILNSNMIVCKETHYGNKLLDIINYYKQNGLDTKYQFYMFLQIIYGNMFNQIDNIPEYVYKNEQLFDTIKENIFNLPKILLNKGKIYNLKIYLGDQCKYRGYVAFGDRSPILTIQFTNLTDLKETIQTNTNILFKNIMEKIRNHHSDSYNRSLVKYIIPNLSKTDNDRYYCKDYMIPTISIGPEFKTNNILDCYVDRRNIEILYQHLYSFYSEFLNHIQELEILFDTNKTDQFSHPLTDCYKNLRSGFYKDSQNQYNNTMTFNEFFNYLKSDM